MATAAHTLGAAPWAAPMIAVVEIARALLDEPEALTASRRIGELLATQPLQRLHRPRALAPYAQLWRERSSARGWRLAGATT